MDKSLERGFTIKSTSPTQDQTSGVPPQMVSFTERGYRDKQITSMKRKRYTTEQIIAILRQADTGKTVQEICRGNNLSEQTFYRWGKKYGHLELADALAI